MNMNMTFENRYVFDRRILDDLRELTRIFEEDIELMNDLDDDTVDDYFNVHADIKDTIDTFYLHVIDLYSQFESRW